MKKIPTLFERVFDNGKIVGISEQVTPGCEFVLEGKGIATLKVDGSCCAIIDDVFYKRYDAKKGKPVPEGAIKCQEEADEVTGHLPCWVKVDINNPSDKWFVEAWNNATVRRRGLQCGTYEAIGKHFQGNKYDLDKDILFKHGDVVINELNTDSRSFVQIRQWLSENDAEGIVFWLDGEPKCKIKRSDFGLKW